MRGMVRADRPEERLAIVGSRPGPWSELGLILCQPKGGQAITASGSKTLLEADA
jgi:hypothetical protein